jgi:hypothetical protein
MADEWTDADRERFAGILGRSSNRARNQRAEEGRRRAALNFIAPVFDDVMRRSDGDLPTGARELVAGAMLGLTRKDTP